MEIQIIDTKELASGKVEVLLDIDDEARKLLLNLGLITAIEHGMTTVTQMWNEESKDE